MHHLERYLLSALPLSLSCVRAHTCTHTCVHIYTYMHTQLLTDATDGLDPAYLLPLATFLSHSCQREHGWTVQFLHLLTILLFGTPLPTPSPFSFTSSLALSHRLTHSHLLELTPQRGIYSSPVFLILRSSMFGAALGGAGGSLFSYST